MDGEDYKEILDFTRVALQKYGLGGFDERIMADVKKNKRDMYDIQGEESSFHDLIFYLTHLLEEISLRSDFQVERVLSRVRRYVTTSDGGIVEGLRIIVSDQDRVEYNAEYIDLAPNSEVGDIAKEFIVLIDQLRESSDQDYKPRA